MAFTIVTATVVDSDGQSWFRGSWKLEFVPNSDNPNLSKYVVDGTTPLNPSVITQSGTMDSSGAFAITLYDNTSITPVGSSWKLTVCPLASSACGFYSFAAAGALLNISSALTFLLPPPRFLGVYPNYGYRDGEVTPSNKPGSTYYNVTQQVQKYYNDQTQTWAIVGTGPAGQPGPPGNPSTIVTTPGLDLNTFTTQGIYYLVQGSGANTPSNMLNSDMSVLEVFAYSGALQAPYILQRLYSSQDTSTAPGRFYLRWNWLQVSSNVWSPWFYFLPSGNA